MISVDGIDSSFPAPGRAVAARADPTAAALAIQNGDGAYRRRRWYKGLVKAGLELRHLRVFVTVVDQGSLTRAARALGVSQSTASETLTALERALGTGLLRKTSRGQTLTPSGEAVLPYARRILALTADLVAELTRVSTDVNATLVVAAVESVSAYVLPSRLAALRERWPKARVEVITGICSEIRDSVAAGKCDLGLVLEGEGDGPLDDTVLAKTRLVVLCSPACPPAPGTASPHHLQGRDFYMSDAAGSYHQLLRQYFEAAQLPPPKMQTRGTVEGVKRGVLAGGPVFGLLPAHAVAQELRDGVLAEVQVRPALPGLVLRVVSAPGGAGSPLVDDLVESLRGSAAQGRKLVV
jgi:DNA-binding transcriptional LysR family regulator